MKSTTGKQNKCSFDFGAGCPFKLKRLTCDITSVFLLFSADGSVVVPSKLARASTYHYNGSAISLQPPCICHR